MPTPIGLYLTALGIVLVSGVLLSRASAGLGVPALLAFLAIGMLAGENGLGIRFNDYRLTFDISITALVLILFDGGLNTPLRVIRTAVAPAIVLATAGVVASALLVGLIVHLLIPLTWTESLLVGSILASTDSAAVFSVLGHAGIQLKRPIGMLLELESGLNDPMAVLLVSVFTLSLRENSPMVVPAITAHLASALIIGALSGAAIGWLGSRLVRLARPPAAALLPLLTIAVAFLSFGVTTMIEGSGFMAAYISAVVVGNAKLPYRGGILRVHGSLTWLAQVLMFSLLGLLVTPAEMLRIAIPGLAVALFSALIARPAVAAACLLPFRFKPSELLYVGLVGLRGATPIILAIYPVVAGVHSASTIFNLVFFAVVINTLFPGMVVRVLANALRISSDEPIKPPAVLEILSGVLLRGGDFLSFTVENASAVSNAMIRDIPMPAGSSILLIVREDQVIAPNGA
ncbi:MAG TPA: potassium/proton antiporter, partial [Candidatus Binataceae bacterium]|nr:potassium/proton antiporter [Candidatus Binataceae bacterium]